MARTAELRRRLARLERECHGADGPLAAAEARAFARGVLGLRALFGGVSEATLRKAEALLAGDTAERAQRDAVRLRAHYGRRGSLGKVVQVDNDGGAHLTLRERLRRVDGGEEHQEPW